MTATQPALVDAEWPEHPEDLSSIMFAHSVLKRFDNELTVTSAMPAPEEINVHFANHPLNLSHHELSKDECANLWNDLFAGKEGTIVLKDVKVEALRQVRIYIRKGIDALRKHYSTQALKRPRPELTESEVADSEESSTKRRKIEPKEIDTAEARSPAPEQAKVDLAPEPAQESGPIEAEIGDNEEAPTAAPPADSPDVTSEPAATLEPPPETESLGQVATDVPHPLSRAAEEGPAESIQPEAAKGAESDFNESDSSGNHDSDVPDSEAGDAPVGDALAGDEPAVSSEDGNKTQNQDSTETAAPASVGGEDDGAARAESPADSPAGSQAGTPSGPPSGSRSGSASGSPSGSLSESPSGSPNGSEESGVSRLPSEAPEDAGSHQDAKPSSQPEAEPEAKPVPEPVVEAAAAPAKTESPPTLRLPEGEQKDANAVETPRSRRRSRASRASRSARSTPQASRDPSVEPAAEPAASTATDEPVQTDAKDLKEPSRAPKRKGSTPTATDREPSPSTHTSLLSLIGTLFTSAVLEPFKEPFTNDFPVVLSATDLSTIRTQVENGDIQSMDLLEQELAKMLANAVMGPGLDVAEASVVITNELASFGAVAAEAASTATTDKSDQGGQSQTQASAKRKK